MWEGLGECIAEARAEHDDELRDIVISNAIAVKRDMMQKRIMSRDLLTAMSGLSASTGSWGGEAGRGFFGGDGTAALPFLIHWSRLPPVTEVDTASSSVGGAEDKDESPEDDISFSAWGFDVGYGKFTGAKGWWVVWSQGS